MVAENSYLILPGCDDTNRGDQALIWETIDIAKRAGYIGKYYMLAAPDKCIQSAKKGIENVDYILKHPSTYFKSSDNISYTKVLLIKWAIRSAYDFVRMELLIHPFFRKHFSRLYSKSVQQSLAVFSESSAGFVKGGGFLHAHGGFADTYKIYYFLFHIRLALSFGIDIFVMPNSFGPFKSPFVKRMLHRTLSKCKVVMSREHISQQQLEANCNIHSYCFADLAFHLNADQNYDARSMLLCKGVPLGGKKCVSLTMRPYRFPEEDHSSEKYAVYQKSLAEFILWLSANGYYPTLIEHVSDCQEHENDMTCIEEVTKLISGKCTYSVISERQLNSEQMKKIYSCFDYIVGTRFHSVIFSLASKIPAIAICYGGNKGIGIMHDLGLDDYCMSISDITPDQLINAFEKMVTNEASIKEQLEQNLSAIMNQKQMIVDLIKEA